MRKIRIGNDFSFEWSITRYGATENLATHNLTCYLLNPVGQKAVMSYTTQGNKIKGVFEGKNQTMVGVYNLILVENEGLTSMTTIDQVQAFMLVPHTYMADAEGTSSVVTLTGELSLPSNGASAYEIAVAHGFVGTETEWLASIIKPVNDYLTTATASETARTTAETSRASAETLRASAESDRVSNESARVSRETARVSAENARVSAESSRTSAESARVTAESSRVSAETARATEFASIKSELAEEYTEMQEIKEDLESVKSDMISTRNNMESATSAVLAAETSVQSAEDARVIAENARKEAESSRVSAESARVAAESARATSFTESKATFDADAAIIAQEASKLTNLESEVSEIAGAFVDVSTLTEYKYAILDTLKWGSNNLAKHIYIPISAGQTIKIVGNATNNTYGAFLTTIAGAVSAGASIPIVSGQSRVTITANQSNSFTAPTGAVCFCLVTKSASGTNVTDVTPQSVAVILKNIASVVESIDGRITEDEEFLWLNGAMSRHGGKRVNTYVVTSSGLFTTNPQNGYSIFYRVKAGSTIHIKANASLATTYTFTTDTYVYAGRIAHFATGYTTNVTISAGEEADVVVPSNAKYLLLWETTQSGNDKFPATLTASNAITDTIPSVDDVAQIREDVDTLMGGGARTDIVSLNDPIFTENMLRQISRTYYPTSANAVKPLVLLHFSDIHGYGTSQREMVRLMEFKERYDSYIDDAICTGDMIYDSYDRSNMTFWDNAGADDIMTVIGNHDATDSTQQTQPNDGTGTTSKQCYDRYVAPYVENWGVTITGEVCYYYKDYATEKIRLVVLDEYHYDTAQDSWLVATLESARTLGYHILMATHSVNGNLVNREGTFAMLEGSGDGMKTTIGSKQRVQDFMDAGGKLICWICGHGHYDNMGYSYGFENQLRIQVTCAKADAASKYDVERTANTKFEDAFNIMSIDTRFGFIRIFRIGADYDRNMRHRSTILIDYINHKIISNWSVYGLDAIAKIESKIGDINTILTRQAWQRIGEEGVRALFADFV